MNEPVPPITPQMAYFHGINGLPLHAPALPIHIDNSQRGPCQKLFRAAPSPDIDDLDVDTIYAVAVAIDRCGFELDKHGRTDDDAFGVHGALTETANTHMQRYRDGECGPLSAGTIIAAFCGITETDPSTAAAMRADVENVVNSQEKLLEVFEAARQRGVPKNTLQYADPSIESAVAALLGKIPTYHIESAVYDQSEISAWDAIEVRAGLFPAPAFTIAVDGETWVPLIDDPTRQAQTLWLIFDGRDEVWYLYECAKTRGIGHPSKTQIVGAMSDTKTGETRCFESSSTFVPESGGYQPWAPDGLQANRLVRVALTVMMLLKDDQVTVIADEQPANWTVTLPPGQTVDEVIARVLARAKRTG